MISTEGANSVKILVAIFVYLTSRYGEIIIFFQTTMETEKVWIKTEEEEEEEKAGEVTPFFSEERPCIESVESER